MTASEGRTSDTLTGRPGDSLATTYTMIARSEMVTMHQRYLPSLRHARRLNPCQTKSRTLTLAVHHWNHNVLVMTPISKTYWPLERHALFIIFKNWLYPIAATNHLHTIPKTPYYDIFITGCNKIVQRPIPPLNLTDNVML